MGALRPGSGSTLAGVGFALLAALAIWTEFLPTSISSSWVVAFITLYLLSRHPRTRTVRPGTPPTGTIASLSNGDTRYVLEGPTSGDLVVVVQGMVNPLEIHDAVAANLVKAGFRVLRYDAAGRGWSDHDADVHPLATWVGQLVELLVSLGLPASGERVHLYGHSVGGLVASRFSQLYPQLVRRKVLMAPCCRAYAMPAFVLFHPFLSIGHALFNLLSALGVTDNIFREGMKTEVSEWSPALAAYTDEHLLGYFREHPAAIKMFTTSLYYLAMLDGDNRGFDRFYRTPTVGRDTLFIWGDNDAVVPWSQGAELLGKLEGNPEHVVIPGGKHYLQLDPAFGSAFIDHTISFLKKD